MKSLSLGMNRLGWIEKIEMMAYTDIQIEKAVDNLKHTASIVRHFDGYVILAQSERDFETKCRKILKGDRAGFCTIERALTITPPPKPE